MVQNVQSENGEMHSFPDDATPEEMNQSINLDNFKNAAGYSSPSFGQNLVTGILKGGQSLLNNAIPNIASMVPSSFQNAMLYPKSTQTPLQSFDPYKTMGTTNQSPSTLAGFEQSAGSLIPTVMAGRIAASSINPVVRMGFNYLKNAFQETPKAVIQTSGNPNPFNNPTLIPQTNVSEFNNSSIQSPSYLSEIKVNGDTNPFNQPALKPQTNLSEFNNISIPMPKYLSQEPMVSSPEEHAENLMDKVSQGERPEEAGKQFALNTKNIYSNKLEDASNQFNTIFDQKIPENNERVGDQEMYQQPDPLTGVKRQGQYIDAIGESKSPYPNDNLNILHNNLMKNPTIDNAHALQSELFSEQAYLSRQNDLGNLDQAGRNLLGKYSQARQALRGDITDTLSNIDPSLPDQYSAATKNWREQIIPYHVDSDLKDIATGQVTNPTTSTLNGIFKNPDNDIQQVVSDMSPQDKTRISYLGMGKLPEENTPSNLISARKSLEKKGLGTYLSPELSSDFDSLQSKIDLSKQAKNQSQVNQDMISQLQAESARAEAMRNQQATQRISSQNLAKQESQRIFNEGIKKQSQANQNLSSQIQSNLRRAESTRNQQSNQSIASQNLAKQESQRIFNEGMKNQNELLNKHVQEQNQNALRDMASKLKSKYSNVISFLGGHFL